MKLVSKDHLIELDTNDYAVHKIIIENKDYYRSFVHALYCQNQGETGNFLLYEGTKELNFSKKFHIILQPLFVEISDRKSKNKISERLVDAIYSQEEEDKLTQLLADLNSISSLFISKSDFRLSHNNSLSLKDIINLFDFKLDSVSGSFLENLIEYIVGVKLLEGIDHFILLNLEDYLTEGECIQFYDAIRTEHIHIIDVECRATKKLSYERLIVIDNDLCLLEY